ncbi:phage tail protein [Pseudomonas sp. NPDC086581]|uniref:phage tail-collar fiber domain-containing protein n=1 Tax=Pseudomonas sp. NPDC086581 TaxID=3364432 RepID=UPI0037FD5D30
MAVTYYALLTTIGAGKLANATALGTTLKITQLAVGDGGGDVPAPDASRTRLVNEVRRAPLNRLSVDPANSAQIIAEQVIPEDVGGWWIREMGLYDEAGALIAYANCAPSYKPQLAEGSGRTQTVRIVLIVSNAASVELKIDPSVVLATREYVDNSIVTALNRLDYKQSVRAATTASVTLSGLQTVDGVALAAGDRVLVKNQTSAVDNGLYVVAAGVWKRATDADENSEVTPGLTVTVESGTAQADSVWQLVTDGVIVLGTTALAFQNITNGLAKLASPAFSGVPTAPTAAVGSNTQQLATTAFTQAAIAPLAAVASPAFTGTPTAPTASAGSNTQQLATTAFVQSAVSPLAAIASPAFSGVPTAPTAAAGTNSQQLATTAFIQAAIAPLATSASAALTGNPTAPTPAQFDNDTSIATTAFVQTAGLHYGAGGGIGVSASTTLTVAQSGRWFEVQAAGITVTLPALSTTQPSLTTYTIRANAGFTLKASGAETLMYGAGNVLNTYSVLAGQSLTVVSNGPGGNWYVVGDGFGSSMYGVLKTAAGYQKLPSGLIIQWGGFISGADGISNVAWPIPFPSGVGAVTAVGRWVATGLPVYVGINNRTNTGGVFFCVDKSGTPGAMGFDWMAIGY